MSKVVYIVHTSSTNNNKYSYWHTNVHNLVIKRDRFSVHIIVIVSNVNIKKNQQFISKCVCVPSCMWESKIREIGPVPYGHNCCSNFDFCFYKKFRNQCDVFCFCFD